MRDSPRDVQRVKGHGQGNVPSSLTRRADLLSAVCSIEEHFARSQNSETKKEDRKDQTELRARPLGEREECSAK